MKITKIDEFIKKTVKKGETIYVGVSAGSIIAGPNIEIAGWGSEGDINEIGLVDLFGLGLTDFSVYPHFKDYLKQEVEEFKNEVNYLVFELTDNDAIWQDEKGRKLIV
jgi:peptidase E